MIFDFCIICVRVHHTHFSYLSFFYNLLSLNGKLTISSFSPNTCGLFSPFRWRPFVLFLFFVNDDSKIRNIRHSYQNQIAYRKNKLQKNIDNVNKFCINRRYCMITLAQGKDISSIAENFIKLLGDLFYLQNYLTIFCSY